MAAAFWSRVKTITPEFIPFLVLDLLSGTLTLNGKGILTLCFDNSLSGALP